MAITDELREWIASLYTPNSGTIKMEGERIADRIEAEHEADVSTACRLAAVLDNDALAKRGYIDLPLDADGVPIRIGDMVSFGKVIGILYMTDGVIIRCNEDKPCRMRFPYEVHHHTPTVEDVLREFADAMSNTHPVDVPARIAEYAAKLRLAGDGE